MTLHRDVSDALYTLELKASRQVEEWLQLLVREVAREGAEEVRHERDMRALGDSIHRSSPAEIGEIVRERHDAEVHDLACRIVEVVREARTAPRRGEEVVSWPL